MTDDLDSRVAIWQTYVQTAENTSNRREAINRYMVPTHLAVLSAHWLLSPSDLHHALLGMVGIGVGLLWIVLLKAHSKINEVKYDIIREMESELPAKPFNREAEASGIDSKRRYPALAKTQMISASVVTLAHLAIAVWYFVVYIQSALSH